MTQVAGKEGFYHMEGMFAEVFFALQVKIVPFLKFETRRKEAQF